MTAELLRGAPLAGRLRKQVVAAIEAAGVTPALVNVVVGDQGASASYLASLDKAAAKRGIHSRRLELPADIGQDALCEAVIDVGRDPGVHGVMVQFPLPDGIDGRRVTECIPPAKDVDGLTRASLGHVLAGQRRHTAPATAAAVVEILASDERLDPGGKHVVVIGRSLVVGKPLGAMLSTPGPGGNGTVTLCHSRTPDVGQHTSRADIVVAAAGVQHLVTPDMIRPGAVVVDVGTHPVQNDEGRWTLTGDVHPDVAEVAGVLTPVPGGVGIVTTAVLMRHVTAAALPDGFEPAW